MIVRLWRGEVGTGKADTYEQLMIRRAIPDYRAVKGNMGAWCLRRPMGDTVEFMMLTMWRDLDSVRSFAGEQVTRARYYDFDAAYLLALPEEVEHFESRQGASVR